MAGKYSLQMESWIILAVAAGIFSQLFNFLNRYLLKNRNDPMPFGWVSEFFRLAVYLLILPFDRNQTLTPHSLMILLGLGAINVISVYAFFKMHALTDLSLSSIIARSRLIWVPIIAFLLLGEVLKINQYFGIIVLFIGLSTTVAPHRMFADKGIMYSLATSIIVALLSTVMKAATPLASPSQIMIFMALPTVIILPFFIKSPFRTLISEIKTKPVHKIIASGANLLAMYLTLLALKDGPVGIVSAIYQGMMIIAVVAGIVLLNERKDIRQKIIGSVITLVGISILTMF